jgi:hypothetical protein
MTKTKKIFTKEEIEPQFQLVVAYYQELYRKVAMQPDFVMKCNKVDVYTIWNFIDYFGPSVIRKDFLRTYFEFQFNLHYKKSFRGNRGAVPLSMLIGKTARDDWKNRKKFKFKYHVLYGLKQSVTLKRVVGDTKWMNIYAEGIDAEEVHRAKFLNETKGVLWCYANTSLYNHKSMSCLLCNFSKECKEMLKKEQPRIYKLRGYECI